MKSLTRSEIRKWCLGNGINASASGRLAEKSGLNRFHLPEDAIDRRVLSNALMERLGKRSVLVWITEWGVWPNIDRADLFEAYCMVRQLSCDLTKNPGFLFKGSEFGDAIELVGICAMSLWDVRVFGSKGKPYVYLSHDEIGGASFTLPGPFERLHCA